MSRLNLKRSNSVIFSANTDSFVLNIRPITNSRSTTQIDSLKDGIKIDNVQPIKKWSYLDNSNKSSSCLPDRAIDINMNESASNKMFFQTHKPISSSPEEENTRPFVFESAVTKQNSIDSLVNKLDKGANNKTDYPIPNARPIKNSQSMTQIDSLKDGIKIDNVQPIKKWSYLDNSNKSSSCLPDRAIDINMNESASNKMFFQAHKHISSSPEEENTRPFVFESAVTKQNSIDSLINKLDKGANNKTDYPIPNARPIKNSQSMTQIDSLKDGIKIDNVQPIKKWSYLDNSNNSSSRSPDSAININMNEPASNKMHFRVHKSISSSLVEENTRPFFFKSAVTKQNSIDSLIKKLEKGANAKTDYLMPNARPITNSQSMTQIDSLKDRFKTDKIQPGENRTYFDNFNKTSPSCLSASATNININESLSVKENFQQYKPKSASKVHENTRPFVGNSLAAEENSTDYLITKIKQDAEAEAKFQTVTNGITRQKIIDENKEKENALEASFVDDREDNTKNPSLKSSGSVQSIPENSEGNKVKECGNNENIFEDEQFFDMWNSYVERPLLPLKPLQKHRSLSCTNLVQAIKGFSRKKSGANNRFSSPENTLFESRELCTSEANISNMPPRKVSIESADQNFVRLPKTQGNSSESVTIKSERKSLQHYPWYHLVDAKEASKRLVRMGRNGAFLIRPASNPTNDVLNTLCVMCFGRVYNFHIRNLKDGRITLGRKCKGEQIETFSSLLDMIKYHQTVPITINLAGQVGLVHLLITPPK